MTNYIYPKKSSLKRAISLVTYITMVMLLLSSVYDANAQITYVPVTPASFNNDIIASPDGANFATNTALTGSMPGVTSPTIGTDGNGPGAFTLVANDYRWWSGGVAATCGLPGSLGFTSVLGAPYQLQPYSGNNVHTITSGTYSGNPYATTGTVTLATAASYGKLFVLYESVNNTPSGGSSTLTTTVTFTNSNTQVFSNTLVNWFTTTGKAYTPTLQRAGNSPPGTLSSCSTAGPCIFEMALNILPANYNTQVASISFAYATAAGTTVNTVNYFHFMSLAGMAPCITPLFQPTALTQGITTTSSISGSFTAASGSPSGYLVVRYPTLSSPTNPVDGTTYTAGQTLGTGTVIQASNSTSFTTSGLNGGTAYDFYVYSYNSGATCTGPVYQTAVTPGDNKNTFSTNACGTISGFIPVGPTAPAAPAGFPTLSGALAYIVTNGLGGNTILELQSDYTSAYAAANETYPLTFSSNPCVNSSKTLTIRPAVGVSSVITLTSAHTTLATVVLDGASYITFDGRNGGTGTNKYLSIVNTSTTAAASGNAILLKNDANNNTLTYLDVQSANGNAAANTAVVAAGSIPGAIAIGTAVAGANGNDNNTISFCDIHSTGTIILGAGIFAGNNTTAGTAANNDNNTITDNNIYDFYLATLASAGVDISLGNNNWTITNNHVYQQSTRNYGAGVQAVRGFWITPNTASLTSASGFIITGNYIGGNAANGTGTYTMTGTANWVFRGMDISVGLGTATSIQNNTMTNWSVTGGFNGNMVYGIDVNAGNVNIGTVTGNLVGSTTTNGSITVTTTVTGGSMIGLRSGSTSGGTINFSNNTVSGIDMIGSATTIATGFNGIAASGGVNITVNNNTIGSPTLANSINMVSTSSTSTNAVAVRGIINNSTATGVVNTITNNLVANINSNNNATGAQASTLIGIIATTGTSTITGDTVRNLTSASQTTAGGATPVVLGIGYTSTATSSLISNNTIHTLKSTNTTAVSAIQTAGIWFSGPSSGTHTIEKNFIHSISIASATNSAGFITGMDLGVISGATITVKNNMIRLGLDETGASIVSPCTVRGITKNVPNSNIWFNSIYIGGTGVGTTATPSFCIARTANATDNWRNNILVNNRSNASTGGKHYQIYLVPTTVFTLNYNDYYGAGAGTVFGFNGTSDVASYSVGWVSGDLNSQAGDPQFINPAGTSSTVNLHIHTTNPTVIEQNGINIASVTDDFDGQPRASNTPEDIGADAGNFVGFFCSGPPASATATLTVPAQVCGNVTKTVILSGFSPLPGYTYQWQESATGTGGSFVNVTTGIGGTTSSFTTASLNSSMYYQCVIGCAYGGGTINSNSVFADILPAPVLVVTPTTGTSVCSGANVDLSATGANTYSWSVNPGVTGYPVVSMLIGPNNTATVTSRPTSTLASGTSPNPPPTVATPTWTYTVTGTSSANGCTSSSVIVLNVITTPVVPVQLTYTNTPDPVCAPGIPVTFTVTNPGTIGAGNWIYNWYDQAGTTLLQSTTNTSATDNYTPATPGANGNYIYKVKVSNTLCPASYAVASPTYFVGYSSLNVVANANCGDNGVVKMYPEGQNNFTTWYSNNFATGLLGPAFDASFGNTNFTGGLCNITPFAPSQNGAFVVRNSGAINSNNLQIDFKMSTAPRGFAFNVLGADGMCWSYGSDVTVNTIATGEGGSGTGLKLAFDATANTANNFPGAYLMYNCTVVGQGPGDPGVLAYKLGSWWQGLVNAPVSIVISQNGFITVKINNEVIFDHIPLPAAYLTTNKSTWIHSFTARAGAADELHAIDDLNIRYNTYEYSNNSTTGLDGTWQSSNTFSGLAAGTYPMWVRSPSNPSCVSNVGNAVVGTSPSPSSALTVAASGFNTTICAGSSTDLTTDVSIPGAVFLWETASSVGGPYTPATGTNNTGTYSTGPLLANAYYRCTFTCPSSSPITSTPVLVIVNSGSISSTNSPQTINCINDVATLTAVPGANTTCVWYAAASGGSPLFSGNSYAATPTSLPTTYYVEPVTTLFTNHYDFGGEKSLGGNINGGSIGGTGIASHFNTSASIRIDSIKVLPNAAGTLTVALQNAGSATNILTFNQVITAAQVGNFINVPVNFAIAGSGNYQLTTSGISCSYNNAYPAANYTNSYMNMGGVFSIVGGSSTPTGANSTSIYGTAYNWSITTSCPTGGARVPVVVNANPAFLVSVTPAATTGFCANAVLPLTASSPNAYSSYVWAPITNLYTNAAGTIPYTTGTNQATVYFKSAAVGLNSYTVSTAASGCTNTASASVSTISAPSVTVSATPTAVCPGGNIQLNAAVSSASPYCTAAYASGTGLGDYITNVTLGSINNTTAASSTPYNTYYSALNTNLNAGSAYTVTGTLNNGGTEDVAIWIDYNQNGLFEASEKLGEQQALSFSIGFTVPLSAFNGITRMRVRNVFNTTNIDPCNSYSWGEVEDYNVTISGGINAGGFTYNWAANPTLSATNIANPIAQNLPSTQTYSVVVTAATGCSTTQTINAVVNPVPVPLASSNAPVCEGFTLTLFGNNLGSGQSSTGWSWSGPSYSSSSQNANRPNATVAMSGTYTLTVTNNFGCTSSATASITVNPNPVLSVASVTNASCIGNTDGCIDIDATSGTAPYLFDYNGNSTLDGIYCGLGAGTYFVTVIDDGGCESNINTSVIEEDLVPPAITCPADVTVNNTPNLCEGIAAWTDPVGTDNCSGAITTLTGGLASGSSFPVGTSPVTYTVTDAFNNTATCSFNVIVVDNENPVITCPANIAINSTPNFCTGIATWITPVGTDNCSGAITAQTGGLASGSSFPVGTSPVTYTVTDASNNTATCSFNVVVSDNENPTILCPPTVTVNSDQGVCYATNITLGNPTYGDNCGGVLTIANNAPVQYPVGGTYVQWEVTDLSGNKSSCNQLVIVQDHENPVALCKNLCVYLNSAGVATITGADIDNGSHDNCSIQSLTASPSSFTYANAGANSVTLTVLDINGNSSTCTATVTVGEYYTLFGSDNNCTPSPGGAANCLVNISNGSSVTGNVGSYRLVQTGGGVTINGKVVSGGKVSYANDVTSGSVSAANSFGVPGNVFTTGSAAHILGDIDVSGNINVNQNAGSTVTGTVRHPAGTTYTGPVPGGGVLTAAPVLPALPGMPAIHSYSCGGANINGSAVLNPGSYGNLVLGNAAGVVVTFHGPGNYYFSNISMSQGGIHTFKYDFMNLPGNINIYVCSTIHLGQIATQWAGPNTPDACRVYFEVQGNGINIIGLGSQFYGRMWAPYSGIDVGGGSCCTYITGSLWSGQKVNLNGSVTVTACGSPCPPAPKIGGEISSTDNMRDMLQVYPNPTSGKTTVKFFAAAPYGYTLKVIDYLGKIVLSNESKATEGDNIQEIDLSGFAKGLYLIEVGNNDHLQKVKVVVQ